MSPSVCDMHDTADVRLKVRPSDWLCAPGRYQDYVASLCSLNPTLETEDRSNTWAPLKHRKARISILEMREDGHPSRTNFESPIELQHYYSQPETANAANAPRRRIHILEGLNLEFISILGNQFSIDPAFFVDQERTSIYAATHEGVRMLGNMPSSSDPKNKFLMRYFEMRHLSADLKPTDKPLCGHTGKPIVVQHGCSKFGTVDIVHRAISIWIQENDESWDAVILCDPPVSRLILGLFEGQTGDITTCETSDQPYQGGFRDFMKAPLPSHKVTGPSRVSMAEDLCYYFSAHFKMLPSNRPQLYCSIFLQKIVASHYMLLLQYIGSIISDLEWEFSLVSSLKGEEFPKAEGVWRGLLMWNTRCSWYLSAVEDSMLSAGIPLAEPSFEKAGDWMAIDQDFQLIHRRFRSLQTKMQSLISLNTSLASLAGNRQSVLEAKRSIKEAKTMKVLTFLGLVFIPLAFTCGLLSMNDRYLPGTGLFWIYWAVALPLIILVFLAAAVINLGFDDEGGWSLERYIRIVSRMSGHNSEEWRGL